MFAPSTILAARRRIAAIVAATPLERSAPLSTLTGADVYLKLECSQITGSFKLRGATNALLDQNRAIPVVACSAGNHALGVAHAAAETGRDALLVLPATASPAKIAALRRYPVQLALHGQSYDEAEAEALRIARDEQWRFISPYNDPAVMAGQGTMGIEIFEQLPSASMLLVPVGGGGLISGIAAWAKTLNPALQVIGIQPVVSAVMTASLQAGHMVTLPDDEPSLADGLAGGVAADTMTFALIQRLVDAMLLVSEAQIAAAMRWLLDEHHLVVEGSGAVGVAALLNGLVPNLAGQRIVVLLTGRNITTETLRRILTSDE
jgi:threonine dehydratase